MSFAGQLAIGRCGERLVEGYVQRSGLGTIASYGLTGARDDKAPRLMFHGRGFVIPDVDCAGAGRRFWLEVKTYELAFPNRTHGIDVHGIKRRHHDDYLAVQRESGCPVYLAVLEISTGDLLVARLDALRQYACLCPGCRRGEQRRECEVYFNRADFSRRHRFAAAELVELRAVFAKHRPSRELHHPKPGSAA